MAIRISQLQTATSVDGNEFIVIVQNGVTKKITIGETLFEGAQGPAGTGYVFKGNWSSITGYVVNDVVVYNGSSYVSKTNNNVNHTPGDNTYWGVVALKGDTGAAGATGATGPQGAQGAVGPQGPVGSLDLDANVINNYPNVRPTIDLNFEHQDILDSRVALTRGCESTYFDEFGTLKIAATNEPVFDNNPETGESKGLYVAGPSTDLLFSGLKNDFSAWTKTDTTVTSNIAVAPDGTLTADQIIESTGAAGKGVSYGAQLTVAINRFYTFSVFVKKGVRANAPDHIQLTMGASAQFGTASFANFNISSGIITRVGSNVYDAKVVKLPNGWFRISITTYPPTASSVTSTGGSILFINNNAVAAASPSYTGSTQSDVLVWGPQLEESKRLTPYKYNPYGVVYAQAAHAWTSNNVTAIANFTKAPDESYTAERVAETTTNASHTIVRSLTAVAGKTYTSGVYLKKGIGSTAPDNIFLSYSSSAFGVNGANVNIATGGINTLGGTSTATIEHVGDGWYKCIVSAAATAAGAATFGIIFANNSASTVGSPNPIYAGQTTSDLFVWGMHIIEDSATIPEYIRKADVAVVNAPNKLPLLEGTVVAKAELPQDLAVDIPFAIPERDKYLFDAKSGNNRVSLYVRKPKNVIAQGTEFQTKNLFTFSEGDVSAFPSVSPGISGVVNGIAGFDNAYAFPTNDVSRTLYKNVYFVSGQVYTMSFFVKMDDGSAPTLGITGSQGVSSADFAIIMASSTAVSNISTTLVSGSLYRVSANLTATSTVSNSGNGIQKYASNSAKTFRVTGFQIELGSVATSYQKTTSKIWSNIATITLPDQIAAPTGGVFADRVIETSASGTHTIYGLYIPKENHDYLYSVYLKKGIGVSAPNIIRLTSTKAGIFNSFADFNIASGAVEYSTGCTGSVTDAGNGWYRCSILFPTPEGKVSAGLESTNYVYIQFTNNTIGAASSGLIYAGSVDTDIFAWGAQVEEFERTYPLTFVSNASSGVLTRASSATIDGFDYGIDAARYSGSGVIVEEGTTNLFTNTDGDLTTYGTSNTTLATGAIANFQNAVAFGDNSQVRSAYKNNYLLIPGTQYTISFYVQMDDGGAPIVGTSLDNTADFAIIMQGGTATSLINWQSTLVSGTLYRITHTRTAVVASGSPLNNGVAKYTTNSARSFKVAGYQLELKPYATSYTESGATAYTRAPEILTTSTSGMVKGDWTVGLTVQRNYSNLLNATNTLWECVIDSNNLYRLQLVSDAALKTTGAIQAVIVSNGVTYATKPSKVIENNTLYDIAWSGNGVKSLISINGEIVDVLHYAEPVGALPAVATVGSGVNGVYSALFISKPALNEFQLKQFTTLTALPEPTFIPSMYEDGTLPLYTAELTDASGNVTRAEYAAQLPEGAHKFGLSWNKEKLALFIDGVKVSEKTGQFTLTSSPNTSTICSDYNNKSQWDGSIQRLSIYPRKLDDTIIQAITE